MAAVRLAHGRLVLQVRRVGAIGLALERQQGLERGIGLEQEAVNGGVLAFGGHGAPPVGKNAGQFNPSGLPGFDWDQSSSRSTRKPSA